MKTIMAAMALVFALSASTGIVYAEENEHEHGYEQDEPRDHGDKDRHEYGDRNKDRGDRHGAGRGGARAHQGTAKERVGGFWDWLPF